MVAVKDGQNIFKKVALSERKVLFREIAAEKIQISIKNEADEIFNLTAIQVENDQRLLCHHTESSKGKEKASKVVVNFMYNNERYFLHSQLSFAHGWAVIVTDVDLFQLQRRANARVEVPLSYPARFSLISMAGKSFLIDSRLHDISAGGMKLDIPEAHILFKIGDKARGVLHLGNRRPMEFEVEFRHVIQREEGGVQRLTAGVQFCNIDIFTENRLLSLMMDFQRELYLKS